MICWVCDRDIHAYGRAKLDVSEIKRLSQQLRFLKLGFDGNGDFVDDICVELKGGVEVLVASANHPSPEILPLLPGQDICQIYGVFC